MGAASELLIPSGDLGKRIDDFADAKSIGSLLVDAAHENNPEINADQKFKVARENLRLLLGEIKGGMEIATSDGDEYILSIASVEEQGKLFTLKKNISNDDGTPNTEESEKHILTVLTFSGEFTVHTDNEAVATEMIDEFTALVEAQEQNETSD